MEPTPAQRVTLGIVLYEGMFYVRECIADWLDPFSGVAPAEWTMRHLPLFLAVAHVGMALVLLPLVTGKPIPWPRPRRRKPLLRLVK